MAARANTFGTAMAGVWLAVSASAAAPEYARDVKPILAERCIGCHGEAKQRGGLRLDRRPDATSNGDSGKAIVPKQAGKSKLIEVVSSNDADLRMPPDGPALSQDQIDTLKAWIDGGADFGAAAVRGQDWWSLKPIAKAILPKDAGPIDHFVGLGLKAKGLTPSKETDRRTLIRRLSFDLIGLPPTPEAIAEFESDRRADAYEKLVDRLLASPQYGERWARHWLDVVHYGETHGYDKDQPREHAWPYRDYVMRAFNEDKPYGRFVAEQIAGDALFPGTVDGLEALGFIAAGPWDFIGHAEVSESKIDGKIARHLDRDDFVANTAGTFLGLTVHCAQCHNHKFDPISQVDYYRMQAVFAAIDRTDRTYEADPKVAVKRVGLEAKRTEARAKLDAIEASARKSLGSKLAEIERRLADAEPGRSTRPPEYGYHSALADKQDATKWVQIDFAGSVSLDRIVLKPCDDDFNSIGAGFGFPVRFRIEASDDPAFEKGVKTIADESAKDVPNPKHEPYEAKAKMGIAAKYLRISATKLAQRQGDFNFALAEIEAFDSDGKNAARGRTVTAFDSIEAPNRWSRVNLTDGLAPQPAVPKAKRDAWNADREKLIDSQLGDEQRAERAAHRRLIATLDAELAAVGGKVRTAYIGAVHTGTGTFEGTGGSGGKPRPIHVLARGDVTKPGALAEPGAISAITGPKERFELPANHTERDRRAALARWIADADNPLTWRVMANRVWQYHFGRGIAATPNDFGAMGEKPTHPELLDALADDLRTHQSVKRLHRLIVCSSTYRQSSASTDANAKIDGDNRFLWRQQRRKLEAEAVRDSMLMVSGRLDLTMGGPSFRDFKIEKPEHSPHYQYHLHDPNDAACHRRTIYRFVVRSKQQPFLAALDCADPSLQVDKRNETLSPQQALALLNNKLSVAMAEKFAERVDKLGKNVEEKIASAYRIALGREPTKTESEALAGFAEKHGLSSVCRVIFNLNEFSFVD